MRTSAAPSLEGLAEGEAACRNCELFADATQVVPGDGPQNARLMFVGEQPGDREDLEGRPFVGPAGRMLDRALAEAGIERGEVFITNAVKHFRWQPRGKKRIHQKPNLRHIRACQPWLEAEVVAIEPEVLVCLGAVAAQAVLGADARVTELRGRRIESPWAPSVLVTVHPSSLLRQQDDVARREAFAAFVKDLAAARALLK